MRKFAINQVENNPNKFYIITSSNEHLKFVSLKILLKKQLRKASGH